MERRDERASAAGGRMKSAGGAREPCPRARVRERERERTATMADERTEDRQGMRKVLGPDAMMFRRTNGVADIAASLGLDPHKAQEAIMLANTNTLTERPGVFQETARPLVILTAKVEETLPGELGMVVNCADPQTRQEYTLEIPSYIVESLAADCRDWWTGETEDGDNDLHEEVLAAMYAPDALLSLGGDTQIRACDAHQKHVKRALAFLPHDHRFTDKERALFRRYLENRLSAFRDDAETLAAVEQRITTAEL
jgi:hypothetical protein